MIKIVKEDYRLEKIEHAGVSYYINTKLLPEFTSMTLKYNKQSMMDRYADIIVDTTNNSLLKCRVGVSGLVDAYVGTVNSINKNSEHYVISAYEASKNMTDFNNTVNLSEVFDAIDNASKNGESNTNISASKHKFTTRELSTLRNLGYSIERIDCHRSYYEISWDNNG